MVRFSYVPLHPPSYTTTTLPVDNRAKQRAWALNWELHLDPGSVLFTGFLSLLLVYRIQIFPFLSLVFGTPGRSDVLIDTFRIQEIQDTYL